MREHREQNVSQMPEPPPPPRSGEPHSDGFAMPFQPGEVIAGKYQIVELIGLGGIGFVVAAHHVELGEKVALKFLRPEALGNAEAVGRFAREARAAVQIKSERVARVFDVGHLPDGAPFLVMEFLEGQDLGALLQEQGSLPVEAAVEYVLQTCEGLAAAHARGVIHRDVKPENLFLQRGSGMPSIKVLDFGISKVALAGSAFESRHPFVQTTMAMGSPLYMSPEQLRASQDIDARTDIWSLGCVLFELLTGRHAFDAPSLTQVTATILEQDSPALRAACPSAPPGLEAIVKHCLAKDPLGRFQDVAELAVALYPYGPARARTSVERCCSLLRLAGLSHVDFELMSVLPRTSGQEPLLQGSLPPGSLASGSLPPGSLPPGSLQTLEAPVGEPAFRARQRWPLGVAAAGLAAGIYAALRSSAPAPVAEPLPAPAAAQAPARSVSAAARPSAGDPASPSPLADPAAAAGPEAPSRSGAPAPAAAPPPTASAPAELPSPAAHASPAAAAASRAAEGARTTPAPASVPGRRRSAASSAPAKAKPAPLVHPAPSAEAEPDVGF